MQHAKSIILLAALMASAGLAGCATNKGLDEGRQLLDSGQTEAGLARLKTALADDPGNLELKAYYHYQRESLANRLIRQAQGDIDLGRFDEAQAALQSVLNIHPENPRATTLLYSLGSLRAQSRLLEEGRVAIIENKPALAAAKARQVLEQAPSHPAAIDMLRKTQVMQAHEENAPRELSANTLKKVTLEFRDTPLRNVFDMISRQSGINFVFDKDIKLDLKATLFARNTTVADAIAMLLSTGGFARKVMSPTTLLIYPDTPQKHKQYQELTVKSFYLGNADAKSTMAMLRVLIKARDLYVDERLNQLVMRDTPEAIRLAEKIISVQDIAEPEVMLHVEILEVSHGRAIDLGIQYPGQFSVITPTPPLTLENLQNLSPSEISVSPAPGLNIQQDNSDINILANPRIRVKNREKAKIHIGDKVPVITSNATSTGVISESVSYLDVGLKLDVEPSVQMRDDVQIKVSLEVSNIVDTITSNSGTLTYQIGTRTASTTLRLKDGETQVLAGLISETDRKTASGIPGLIDLPLFGRLFSTQNDERSKTEIVLLITPHILRNAHALQPAVTEFRGGTENSIGGPGGISQPAALSPLAPPELPPEDVSDTVTPFPQPEVPPIPPANLPPTNLPPDANPNAILPAPDAAPSGAPLTPQELQNLDSVSPVFPTQ